MIAARLIVVLVSLAIPLVALEIALRMFGPFLPGNYDTGPFVRRHPVLGHFHIPSHTSWVKTPRFTVRIDTNPMGFRDPRQSYEKPPGAFRILLLGDSYVEAAQVPVEQGIAQVLERKLTASLGRPIEVINGGVLGYGTAQESLLLDQEGAKLKPDLIVLFFCHCNDLANNNYRLELIDGQLSRALKPYYDLSDDDSDLVLIPPPPPDARTTLRYRVRDSSLLYNVIETGVVYKLELQNPREAFNAIDGLVEPTRGKYDARPSGEWERSWRITERVLAIVKARADSLGAPLLVAGIPEWRMLEQAYWQRDSNKRLIENGRGGPDAPVRTMTAVTDRLGIGHLDLLPPFQRQVDAGGLFRYYIEGDYHWTADGHVVAADAVAAYLAEKGLLPR
ncbi:MAG: SGNH/GDSL hydrolase family protein [Chloroflexi bacterium]|nr:SGNH/GDSL hydrolase family protein [Chloroflexota bacterium]